MKYILMIGDGMGDYPMPALNGRTPLEAAATPNLDYMAQKGLLGRACTVPEGMTPGSDVAIMSLMGYNPVGVLSGRGPLEAASRHIETSPEEVAFRLNLITVEHTAGGRIFIRNHAAGYISTEESIELIDALREKLPFDQGQRLYPGVSFRHILIWPDRSLLKVPAWQPHDFRDRDVTGLIENPTARPLMDLVKASWEILENHPINQKRRAKGLDPANSVWIWGAGVRPAIKTYRERWGITGATVSAVDLIKGLGTFTGLETINVPGATGWLDTNFEGKVEAALEALKRLDFVAVHIEAPDEASHQGELDLKIKAISDFDARVVGPMLKALPDYGPFRVLAACDHYTPLSLKTHSADPVPFILYESESSRKAGGLSFNEKNAASTGLLVDPGADLGDLLFGPEKIGG